MRTLAATISLSTALTAAAQEPPPVQWDHTHTYAEVVTYLNGAVKAFPKLTKLHTIGKSYLGKDLLVLEVTNQATGGGRDKPGYWVDGCLHAGEVAGGEITLHTIHYLLTRYGSDPLVTDLVDTRVFYIMPKLNPDGSDHYITTPDGLRSVVRPFDDDEDGRLDEDPGEDLDGDGYVTVVRVRDPNGPMKTSPDDPRLMVPITQGTDPAGWKGDWRVYSEGIDNDGDGRFNEDGLGGIDVNRNFPENWKPDPISTNPGPYPLSESESRAVVDFHLTLDNLTGAINYHMAGNVAVYPPSNLQLDPLTGDVIRQPFEDEQTYKRLGGKAVELVNHVKIQVFKIHGASPASWHGSIWGVLADWWYYRRGIFGWIHEVGINPGAKEIFPSMGREIDRLRWSDENMGGKLFKPWTPFNHPALGPVEIGGFINKLYDPKYKTYTNVMLLPGPDYQKLLTGHTHWILYLASQSPLVRVSDAQATREGPELKITAEVRNVGALPTNVTQQALEGKLARTVKARIVLQGASLVGGSEAVDLGHLPGNASNAPRRLEWRVKLLGTGQATATVEVASEKGGKHARTLKLAQ